jgi:hypothetical protein
VLAATALLVEPLGRGASWRERAFSTLTLEAIEGALAGLDRCTERAHE